MNYQNLQPEENEILSVEDEKIRQLCGGLKRVEAPKDFHFQIKARIAERKTQSAKSPLFAFLRYAAPLGLVLVILGVVVSNNLYSVDTTAVPPLAEGFTQTPLAVENPLNQDETQQPFIARNSGPNANFENETASNSNLSLTFSMKDRNEIGNVLKTNPTVENNGGGSRDSASRQTRVINPLGFNNSNRTVETANNFTNPTSFFVKDILSQIGIVASFSGSGWRVQSVIQNSIAERSGIKPNDVIEEVNNIKILTEKIETNSINATKLTVVREGIRKEIPLR